MVWSYMQDISCSALGERGSYAIGSNNMSDTYTADCFGVNPW